MRRRTTYQVLGPEGEVLAEFKVKEEALRMAWIVEEALGAPDSLSVAQREHDMGKHTCRLPMALRGAISFLREHFLRAQKI